MALWCALSHIVVIRIPNNNNSGIVWYLNDNNMGLKCGITISVRKGMIWQNTLKFLICCWWSQGGREQLIFSNLNSQLCMLNVLDNH